MYSSIKKINTIITKSEKKKVFLLSGLSFIVALMESASISLLMPFIVIANNPDLDNHYINLIKYYLDIDTFISLVFTIGAFLIIFFIIKNLISVFYNYHLAYFTHYSYYMLSKRLYASFLKLDYRTFIEKNSAELIHAMTADARSTSEMITSFIILFSEAMTLLLIYSLMLIINYQITFALTIFLSINILIILLFTTKRIKNAGEKTIKDSINFYKIIYATFGNFKLIKLKENDQLLADFYDIAQNNVDSNTPKTFYASLPRIYLEIVGFTTIISIVFYLVWEKNGPSTDLMGILGVFVVSLIRLLPSLNKIVHSYNIIKFNHKALAIVDEKLSSNIINYGNEQIVFAENIQLKDVTFYYDKSQKILDKINLTINKGERIAFIGESGNGKTTLIDIIIGLLTPKEGEVLIDSKILTHNNMKSWRNKIGYIPQNVYLFDGTVGENVAFGETYDPEMVKKALIKANIYDFLTSNLNGLNTLVGDGGIMLSGGQKQRIGIARALYSDPEILILDEATSALDIETENGIMDEIYNLNLQTTIIIIAHRLNTITRCNKKYKIINGEIFPEMS